VKPDVPAARPAGRDAGLVPCFPEQGHDVLRSLRDGHFWFTHRRRCILESAQACLGGRSQARVLEFGCGDGHLVEALSERWLAFGLERRLTDLLLTRRAGTRVVLAEGGAPPFAPSFDLVGLFDVVEHVEDDAELLARAAGLALPGGWILVTVPADPRLWSSLDEYAGHLRRYTRAAVFDLFARAGLEPIRVVPLFRLLWPLGRLRARLFGRRPVERPEDEYRVSTVTNRALAALLRLERAVAGGSERGAGTSWLALGRARGNA